MNKNMANKGTRKFVDLLKQKPISERERVNRAIVFLDMMNSSVSWIDSISKNSEKWMPNTVLPSWITLCLEMGRLFECVEQETSFLGDGLMLTFDYNDKDAFKIIDAVNCARMILLLWWEMGGHRFLFRAGVHVGEVNKFTINEDFFNVPFKNALIAGDVVNRASRIEGFPKDKDQNIRWDPTDINCLVSGDVVRKILKFLRQKNSHDKEDFIKKHFDGPQHFEFERKKKSSKDDLDWMEIYRSKKFIENKKQKDDPKGKLVGIFDEANELNNKGYEYASKGVFLKASDKFCEAIRKVKESEEYGFGNTIYRRNYAEMCSCAGKFEEAEIGFNKLEEMLDGTFELRSPMHFFEFGKAYKRQAENVKSDSEQIKFYEKALEKLLEAKKRFRQPVSIKETQQLIEICGEKIAVLRTKSET